MPPRELGHDAGVGPARDLAAQFLESREVRLRRAVGFEEVVQVLPVAIVDLDVRLSGGSDKVRQGVVPSPRLGVLTHDSRLTRVDLRCKAIDQVVSERKELTGFHLAILSQIGKDSEASEGMTGANAAIKVKDDADGDFVAVPMQAPEPIVLRKWLLIRV